MNLTRSLKLAFDFLVVTLFLLLVLVPWGSLFSSKVSILHQLEWPSTAHWLGTDNLGRDLLVRISDAIRFAVLPLWLGITAMAVLGVAAATAFLSLVKKASWFQSITDITLSGAASIPVALLAFIFAVMFETSNLWMVMLSVGFILSVHSFLFVKGLYLKSENLGYWQAHESIGGTRGKRIFSYGVQTHWLSDIVGNLAFYLKVGITVEASLSYLGFGVQEPNPSFGNMLASHFDSYMRGNWMVLVVIAVGLVLCAYFPTALLSVYRSLVCMRLSMSRLPDMVTR